MEAVQDLQKHPLWVRTAEGMKDADKIKKVFQNMSILCDAFQVSFVPGTDRSSVCKNSFITDGYTVGYCQVN